MCFLSSRIDKKRRKDITNRNREREKITFLIDMTLNALLFNKREKNYVDLDQLSILIYFNNQWMILSTFFSSASNHIYINDRIESFFFLLVGHVRFWDRMTFGSSVLIETVTGIE